MGIGSDAGALEALPLQDAEPELDLVEPRRVQREEFEPDPSVLRRDPRPDARVGMNREVVRDDDQPASRPTAAEPLQQLEELLVTAAGAR